MLRGLSRYLCVLSLVCAGASGQELWSWHGTEITVPLNAAWDVTVHTRLRTRHEFQHVAQFRFGPLVSYRTRRYAFRGAYYFEPDNPSSRDPENNAAWESGHRIWGSAEANVEPSRGVTVIPRFMWERFVIQDRANYNRYRLGARVNIGRASGPYVHSESMLVASGLQIWRNGGGMRLALGNRLTVEGGWLLDVRAERWGGNRQAVVSSVRYVWGE